MSDRQTWNRRQFVHLTALSAAGWPLLGDPLAGAEESEPLNRFPRMVHNFFVEQVRRAERRGLAIKARLKTKEDAEAYVQSVQRKIRACFGPEPKRTPLNARITGKVERDDYTIEKIIFESRPNFPVTANFYLPKGHEFPVPGVVGTCGHSTEGKGAEAYQSFAQGLARLGYACLIYDPIGQGERLQYTKPDLTARFRPGVTEHIIAGNQQFLVGEFFGMWRAWDGIRALDYLLSRQEVDQRHLGVTGNSGGGTMTTWLCGVESRWTMGAPSCFVTTFRRNLENELPADTEQCPPKALAMGLDHDDFLAAMAPKPVIILAKERDYFDVRGSEEAYRRLKDLYSLFDAPENIDLCVGPTTHGYSQENREAMYRWFNGVTEVSDAKKEPEITIEEQETLWCTPKGQVAGLEKTRTVLDFTRDKARRLKAQRGDVAEESLRAALPEILKLPARKQATPDYRIWRYLGNRQYPSPQAIAYAVETEPGIQAIIYRLTEERWYSRPPKAGKRALLYVAHLSSDEELRSEPLIKEVMKAEPEVPVFTCDVRGIGESQPQTGPPDSFHGLYGSDYFYAIHSLMLDRPYLGQKTFDLLRVIDWLDSIGHTEVHLIGKGRGALSATFAALLRPNIVQITLKNALTSYHDLAHADEYNWPLSAMLPNVLARFDLPDCYRALKAKKLRQIEPWGPMAEKG